MKFKFEESPSEEHKKKDEGHSVEQLRERAAESFVKGIEGSELDEKRLRKIIMDLPEEYRRKAKVVAEWFPRDPDAAGATYLAIWELDNGIYLQMEVSLRGPLNASSSIKKGFVPDGLEDAKLMGKYDWAYSLDFMLSPMNVTDNVRLRLGEKLRKLGYNIDLREPKREGGVYDVGGHGEPPQKSE